MVASVVMVVATSALLPLVPPLPLAAFGLQAVMMQNLSLLLPLATLMPGDVDGC